MDPKFDVCGVAGARAYGLYLWASMLNHDCLPNVCRFDYIDDPHRENNTDFVFRALHEIKEGSEICTSYVGINRGYRERQRRLMEDYGFKCKCQRCKLESQLKENQGEEEEENEEEEIKVVQGEGVGAEELEMSDTGDDNILHAEYFERYICDCGGYLASLPPSQDGVVSNLRECNGCGIVRKDEPGGAGDVNF